LLGGLCRLQATVVCNLPPRHSPFAQASYHVDLACLGVPLVEAGQLEGGSQVSGSGGWVLGIIDGSVDQVGFSGRSSGAPRLRAFFSPGVPNRSSRRW
jgi:hypothetical protein